MAYVDKQSQNEEFIKNDDRLETKRGSYDRIAEDFKFYELEAGVVLDVIRDETHEVFKDKIYTIIPPTLPPAYNDTMHVDNIYKVPNESVEQHITSPNTTHFELSLGTGQSNTTSDTTTGDETGEVLVYGNQDYSYVGRILIRMIFSNKNMPREMLTWAKPLENGIKEYPLLNEVVIVHKYLNSYYYTRKLNTRNNMNHDAEYAIEYEYGQGSLVGSPGMPPPFLDPSAPLNTFSFSPPVNDEHIPIANSFAGYLGNYFKENHKLRPLKHFEGDLVIEGRFGNSIRFGAYEENPSVDAGRPDDSYPTGTGNPCILIRNRQRILPRVGDNYEVCNNIFGFPILEDVNDDGSSIQITTGKTTSKYIPITTKYMYGKEEYSDFTGDGPPLPILDGDQIVINTDRLVFSSRGRHGAGETFFFAKNRFTIITDDIFTVDSERKMALTTNSSYHLKAHDRIDVKTHNTTTWESNMSILHMTQQSSTWNSQDPFLYNTPKTFTVNANQKMAINSPVIFLGKDEERAEPALLGNTTLSWMASLIYEIIWRLGYKQDTSAPDKSNLKEWVHYTYKDQVMLDLMRQAPNCISRKVFISGNATGPGRGKMKRRPSAAPMSFIRRKKTGEYPNIVKSPHQPEQPPFPSVPVINPRTPVTPSAPPDQLAPPVQGTSISAPNMSNVA